MEISIKVIEEIADQLDCGMNCYLNKLTGELTAIIPDEDLIDAESATLDEEIKQINANPANYISFQTMNSRDSYGLMKDFAEEKAEKSLRSALINALNSKKPFRNFRSIIDNSETCRENWFAYKRNRYIEYVKSQILSQTLK